jgi:Tetratricopeptide repeat/AAA domain
MTRDTRRRALIVASQCQNMIELEFLPPKGASVSKDLPPERRLVLELQELIVGGPGGCQPAKHGEEAEPAVWAPGLLVNPTRIQADAALREAITEAHESNATLLVFYVGHGARHQADPAQPVHHFLQVWDTAEMPASTRAPHNGWDPYVTIDDLRPDCPNITGLIMIVDACFGSWAIHRVKEWAGVNARFRSVWLASSRNEPAYDGCLTRTLVTALREGVPADETPDRSLASQLRGLHIAHLVTKECRQQEPTLAGFQDWDPALFLAANRATDKVIANRGVDPATGDHLLRLLGHYQPHFLADVVAANRNHRVLTIVGEAGSGKSTLAAALFHSPPEVGDAVPPDFVTHAVAFTSVDPQPTELATVIHGQLLAGVRGLDRAADTYKTRNREQWDKLDPLDRLVLGPLSLLRSQVIRIVIDGLDQLLDGHGEEAVRDLIRRVETDPELSHVRLILTSRPGLRWSDVELRLTDATEATARTYLAARGVPQARHNHLARLSGGRWLVLQLAADYQLTHSDAALDIEAVEDLYVRLLESAATRLDWTSQLRPVLSVLAAAGPGPVLPAPLLEHAVAALGGPTTRAGLAEVLADRELHRIIDRIRPGTPEEQVGVFHGTLAESLSVDPHFTVVDGHRAVLGAIAALAAPIGEYAFLEDRLQAYAYAAEASHLAAVGRHDEIATSLVKRRHPIPRENLARHRVWLPHLNRTLGPHHTETLDMRNEIAAFTGDTGDFAEALRLLQELLPDRVRVLGLDHPDTLTTRNNIAVWTGRAGDDAEALRLLQELLPDHVRVRGPDHPDTLRTRSNIAVWTGRAGDAVEALRLLQELLSDHVRVRGPDHPDTLRTQNKIAYWIGETGETQQQR